MSTASRIAHGEAMLSRDRARREAAWDKLEKEFDEGERVEGVIFGRVKGGFTVDLGGAVAFLPGSQVDIRPVRDVGPLMDIAAAVPDPEDGSPPRQHRRLAPRHPRRNPRRTAFGPDPVAWPRARSSTASSRTSPITARSSTWAASTACCTSPTSATSASSHPSEVINIGDTVKVQIIRINRDTQRISLGMKQLESDPWEGAAAKYPVDGVFTRPRDQHHRIWRLRRARAGHRRPGPRLRNELDQEERPPGQDRLAPARKSTSRCSRSTRRSAGFRLGLKQAQANPWTAFADKHPVGTEVEGEVKNSTEFGLFIGLDGDVDGMVHMSDIAWGVSGEEALALHHKGETVKAVVLDVDVEKERISLGMKQLERGGVAKGGAGVGGGVNKGETVTVTVLEVRDGGLEVQVGDDGATGFIKRTDLGRDRDEQRPERFQVGQKFDAHGHRLRPFEEAELLDQGAADLPKRSRRSRSTVRPTAAHRSATSSARR